MEGYSPPFELVDFMVIVENRRRSPSNGGQEDMLAEAMVKVRVGDRLMHTAAEGNGPVNALDNALRKALLESYPSLDSVKLVDYKVRVVDHGQDTRAVVRVLIESTDGQSQVADRRFLRQHHRGELDGLGGQHGVLPAKARVAGIATPTARASEMFMAFPIAGARGRHAGRSQSSR